MLSMKNEIEKIWDDVLVKLEQEHDVSSAAINAWIKPLHIKDVQSNKIILSLDAEYDERGIQFIKKKMYDLYIRSEEHTSELQHRHTSRMPSSA